jgi:hypothetical protein
MGDIVSEADDLTDPGDREAVVRGMLAERAARERIRQRTQVGGDVPTVDQVRAFLHKQIVEVRAMGQREGEDVTDRVNDMLEKLHTIEDTHAFIEQTMGN